MTTKTWHDRIVEKLDALRARDDADKEWYHYLCRYLSNAQGNRDGEKLVRGEDGSTKLYKGEPVFSFSVSEGKTVVTPEGKRPESIADREQALDRMAELLAQAAHDPQWGRHGEGERTAPSKPLYPV
jgi:hypothetical protein